MGGRILDFDTLGQLGDRLKGQLDFLDSHAILEMLEPRSRRLISGIEVLQETDSTNAYLMRQGALGRSGGQVCLAEMQTAGRGRRGKHWVSPFGANLYMSLLWRFERQPAAIGRLSLVSALAVADALTALGAQGIGLKWPNDIFWQSRKLGGILLESACGATGGDYVVIGIGVNVRMPESAGKSINQPWADLDAVLQGKAPSRNVLAVALLNAIVPAIESAGHEGVMHLQELWRRYDFTCGEIVELQTESGRQRGKALGVDNEGRLLLDVAGCQQAFTCGEVSL